MEKNIENLQGRVAIQEKEPLLVGGGEPKGRKSAYLVDCHILSGSRKSCAFRFQGNGP